MVGYRQGQVIPVKFLACPCLSAVRAVVGVGNARTRAGKPENCNKKHARWLTVFVSGQKGVLFG